MHNYVILSITATIVTISAGMEQKKNFQRVQVGRLWVVCHGESIKSQLDESAHVDCRGEGAAYEKVDEIGLQDLNFNKKRM